MSHLVASRDGLFIFDETNGKIRKVRKGYFFGLTENNGIFYIFKSDWPINMYIDGFVDSFRIVDGEIVDYKTQIGYLDPGTHQITVYEGYLYIIETYKQRIARVKILPNGDLDPTSIERIYPWKRAVANFLPGNKEGYFHVNAISFYRGKVYVMCPKLKGIEKSSSVIQIHDPCTWELLEEIDTGRWFCHDLVPRDNEIYFCDALNFICKLNLESKLVTEWKQCVPKPRDTRSICRGLCDVEFVSTRNIDEHTSACIVNIVTDKIYHIKELNGSACSILRFHRPSETQDLHKLEKFQDIAPMCSNVHPE
jgi:hypothetical protein